MKIREATYSNKYVTGPYLNHQPGLVADLDEGEDPVEALIKLKEYCDAFNARVNNFEERLVVPSVQQERLTTVDGVDPFEKVVLDDMFEQAKAQVAAIEFKEDALKWMNNNGWTYNIELKAIANSKPSKTP